MDAMRLNANVLTPRHIIEMAIAIRPPNRSLLRPPSILHATEPIRKAVTKVPRAPIGNPIEPATVVDMLDQVRRQIVSKRNASQQKNRMIHRSDDVSVRTVSIA